LNGRILDRRQVQASYISCVGLYLVQCCEHLHFHDFVRLLLVDRIILLYNRICAEFESHVQIANRCAPWKIASGAEILVLALQFQ
jgi:hypothetical protein